MNIIEISETIHGEQPFSGSPVTLIRFKECNLACPYCDANLSGTPIQMTTSEIIDTIGKMENRHVLFTGGEPLLVERLSLLCEQVRYFVPGTIVTIETNGTLPVVELKRKAPYTHIVMDVKLFDRHLMNEARRHVKALGSLDVIKFVYWDHPSFNDAWNFVAQDIPHTFCGKIVFSPTKPQEASFAPEFIQRCKARPMFDIAMQCQLHKVLNVA
jgi:organic radical activating enzyme